ncbi:choice-of-anchor B family protein [Candidatus Palauibacter irciniicola]|uniref:choice-of-anchor B family protein n=1 Tax=Candidatus Palauibacter irciniicola TaxID=3056733 RepID=UPI003B028193
MTPSSPARLAAALRPATPQPALLFVIACAAAVFAGTPVAGQSGSFGHSVLIHEGELLVAEPTTNFRPGAVYVYTRGEEGWMESGVIRGPDPEIADGFGTVLAAAGDHLFVGMRGTGIQIFGRGEEGGWVWRDAITADEVRGLSPDCRFDGYCGTDFGLALAAEGEWLMVGTPDPADGPGGRGPDVRDDAGAAGTIHAYRRGADGRWTKRTELRPSGGGPGDRFGAVVAFTERGLLVGAPGWGPRIEGGGEARGESREGTGRVYRFDLSGDGWTETGSIGSAEGAGSGFGVALSAEGDRLLIGAPGADADRGAVLVYAWEVGSGSWVAEERIVLEGGAEGDRFGAAVAFSGPDVWVGAPTERENETGAVLVYEAEADGTLPRRPRRIALPREETVERDRFGGLVVADGALAAVGAPGMHHQSGSVHLFEDSGPGWAAAGMLASAPDALEPMVGEERRCVEGSVGPFDCSEVELLAFIPNSILRAEGSARGVRANDNWGWTDRETGREYALVGRNDGTSFIDLSDPTRPVLVGDLPKPDGTPPSQLWRDIKTYKDHAFIVADGAGDHGMQVFDLTRLRDVAPGDMPALFEPDVHYRGVASSHNIVINEETGFAYAVGSGAGRESCGGGLHMIDINDPRNPEFVGCFQEDGGTHDAQCVLYRGPDERYEGREICLNSNGRYFQIADVTDKENPYAVSRATSPNAAYIHQGWLTPDHRYFYQDDESDVISGAVETTRTLIWDLSDLEDPVLVNQFMGSLPASAHNLYLKDGFAYQANYRYGLHVLDISDPVNPREVGFFDTAPYQEGPGFGGAWSTYPFFESGTIIVTSMREGLFVLKKRVRPVS